MTFYSGTTVKCNTKCIINRLNIANSSTKPQRINWNFISYQDAEEANHWELTHSVKLPIITLGNKYLLHSTKKILKVKHCMAHYLDTLILPLLSTKIHN